jgi:hypothetical protein
MTYIRKKTSYISLISRILVIIFITGLPINGQTGKKLLFSHQHGIYNEAFVLTISSNIDGAKIRYTLNGSNPLTSQSAVIQDSIVSITIDPSITTNRDVAPGFIVTACATVSDTLVTEIITQTYLFVNKITLLSRDNQVPGQGWLVPGTHPHDISYGMDPDIYNHPDYKDKIEEAFISIPTFSLVTDLKNLFDPDTGIYLNPLRHGEEWERSASLEQINPDGSEGFQINCGVRIRGGWSRHLDNPKHAFRIFFRSEYGDGKLNYSLFGGEGADEFDKVDIATSQNYSWSFYADPGNTLIRDHFSRDTQRDMGQPYTRSRYYHLFINGTYWGLYYTQERSEANFGETYFGGNDIDYDVIKVNTGENFEFYNVEATDGTIDSWRELWDAGEAGFSNDELYFKVQGLNIDGTINTGYKKLLDVDNLIDYMINTFFVGDFDGPVSNFRGNQSPNNFYAVYNRINPDGFKFFRHDAEHSLGINNNPWGLDRTGPFPAGQNFLDSNPQWIHQRLSDNSHYRLRFGDRVYKHFYNSGALTLSKNIERLNKRKNQIETAIIGESARWGDSKTGNPLTKADWTNAVNFILNNFLPTRNNVVLNQLKTKGLFPDVFPPQFNVQGGKVDKSFQVGLSSANGEIYYTTDGSDPYSPYSSSGNNFSETLIAPSASKKVFVPKSDIGNSWITDLNFDDSQWLNCTGSPGGIGYENDSGYESYITFSVKADMFDGTNPNTSCYVRIPFNVESENFDQINFIYLDLMYDDGFAAYLNGVKVAEAYAPANLAWNSTSTEVSAEATAYSRYDISSYKNLLRVGENLLAIQGLNTNLQSSDFLILPQLLAGHLQQSGSISPTAVKYENPFPLNETTHIKARTLDGDSWSALNEASFFIDHDLTSLRVTELHYNPLDGDTVDDREYEFIEFKNIGSTELNLYMASLIEGISYTFGEGAVIAPGGFIVLASNKEEFNVRYGFYPYDEYTGQLDNGGEEIVLIDGVGDTIIAFTYDNNDPWPEEPDGDGYSLVSFQTNPIWDPNSYEYWITSGEINGSPGTDDIVSSISEPENFLPNNFVLYQNYPNPFNPKTKIRFTVPNVGTRHPVSLRIYDILGREVATLVNEEKPAGEYEIEFQSLVDGKQLSSGVYFYSLKAGSFYKTMKMVLLK